MLLLLLVLSQSQAPIELGSPDRTLAAPFSQVAGARELPDGRLLLTDRIEDRVVIADLATGRLTPVGRPGSGPAEYRRPGRLVPMPGDSTLLIDEGNERLQVIDPAFRLIRTFRLEVPGLPAGLWPRGFDREGKAYAVVPRWAASGRYAPRGDSLPLVRLVPGGGVPEIAAWVVVLADPPGQIRYGLPYVPFSPQDGWAVTGDGVLVIARAGDYHVERIAGGVVRKGSPVRTTAIPVTREDKIAYSREFMVSAGMGGRGTGGASIGAVPGELLTDEAIAELVERNTFAVTKPPFTDRPPLLGPDGSLWVERSAARGAPVIFDLFDGAGALVRRVRLPEGRRLLLVGRNGVYLVATDEEGMERVERYRR